MNRMNSARPSLRIGLYSPYLHIHGGGERYIGTIAQILSRTHQVEFLTTADWDLNPFQQKLNLDLSRVSVNQVPIPPRSRTTRLAHKYAELRAISAATRRYDVFVNQETLTTIPCLAPYGVVLCQIPPRRFNPAASWLSNLLRILMGRLFFDYELQTYQLVLVYSRYVQAWAQRYYRAGLPVRILPPPVATHAFRPAPKENLILGVGRFFVGTHNKKQLELIRIFKTLYQTQLAAGQWQLHLVGNVDPDASAQQYARQCEDEAQNYPIYLHFNAPFTTLQQLYGRSMIFWHGAGLNEDETRHPERAEHFGLSTVEAMAAGCIPIVLNKGGQPEIVRDGVDGWLWTTPDELITRTLRVIHEPVGCQQMSQSARARSQVFDTAQFETTLHQLLDL